MGARLNQIIPAPVVVFLTMVTVVVAVRQPMAPLAIVVIAASAALGLYLLARLAVARLRRLDPLAAANWVVLVPALGFVGYTYGIALAIAVGASADPAEEALGWTGLSIVMLAATGLWTESARSTAILTIAVCGSIAWLAVWVLAAIGGILAAHQARGSDWFVLSSVPYLGAWMLATACLMAVRPRFRRV